MKTIKFIWIIGFLFAISLFFFNEGRGQPLFPQVGGKQPKPGTSAPVIKHTFAAEKGYYGYIWKIYIEAEDPDGDMFQITSVVEQPGYGHYPTDWVYPKSPYRKKLKGYLQWNTFASNTAYLREWTEITLRVSVIDKAGNESNVVLFPFTFESGVKNQYQYKLPAPFDQGDLPRLGYIHINLFEPTYNGSDGNSPH